MIIGDSALHSTPLGLRSHYEIRSGSNTYVVHREGRREEEHSCTALLAALLNPSMGPALKYLGIRLLSGTHSPLSVPRTPDLCPALVACAH